MIDMVVHVVAIGAVIGYVEYRLRSYAALMSRFDQMERKHETAAQSNANRVIMDNLTTANKVGTTLQSHQAQLTTLVVEHEKAILEAERSSITQMRDTVGAALKSFSDSVWKGVHSMAQSIQLPASPIFTCYYCGQKFPVTQRERIGSNDYCPEHGNKRKTAVPVRVVQEAKDDDRARLHTAHGGNKHADNDKLPWIS